MQFRHDLFWRWWCSLVGYRLLFHDHRRWTGHPWTSNRIEYIFDAGAKLHWCHAYWIVNFLILMRKFSMRQNVRTCFMLWIQHQTTQTPIAILQSAHDNRCLVFSVTSLKFENVYPICYMEKGEGGVEKWFMTYNIDVDFLLLPLKNAKICSRKFTSTREPDSEPAVLLVNAIFHLKKDVLLGPIHHPRQFNFLDRIQGDLVHLIRWYDWKKKIESKMSEIYHLNDIIIVKKTIHILRIHELFMNTMGIKTYRKSSRRRNFLFLFSLSSSSSRILFFAFQWKQIRQTIKRELSSVRHKRECRRKFLGDSHENSFSIFLVWGKR